jgi:hypothetical protein
VQEATPEEIDRNVEAYGSRAATAMINYYRASVLQSPNLAEAQLRPILAVPSVGGRGCRTRA